MSKTDASVPQLLSELTRSLEALQDELEPSNGGLRPPTPRQLTRFTSEVTIPAIILLLETNIRALRLVQRALRIADGRESNTASASAQTRERAAKLGEATLNQLDSTLGDLQDALEGRPPDDDARQLLDLEDEIEAEMQASSEGASADDADSIEIDVDAELQSLKDDVDADEGNNDNK
jgi:hypothetical protein